jgi:hypothetical protein
MKLLIIIMSHEMNNIYLSNIQIMQDYFKEYNNIVDYCGISNSNDFNNYENIISFKYKIINNKKQLGKICDFITQYKHELDYDWYIKIRPDIQMLESINFDILCDTAVNARARVYRGPKKIKYGMAVNGKGPFENIGDCFYDEEEKEIILDDQFYIFHQNVINLGGFESFEPQNQINWFIPTNNMYNLVEHEWVHSCCWVSRNISLNIIGINLLLKNEIFSGNVNM